MKTIGEALDEMLRAFAPRGDVALPLLRARDLVTSSDVIAHYDLPHFDNSAMDGYAVRSTDVVAAGVSLPVVGESRAGGPWPEAMRTQSAMRIFTGAPMPEHADAVIIQENASRDAGTVTFSVNAKPWSNVRRRGSDLIAGAVCIPAGTILDAGEISMLAGQGARDVRVFRRPRVAIVSTGDELRDVGEALSPGTLFNSNSYALAAAVESVGAEPWILPIARDNAESIERTLREAFEADVVLCCGGVSVGDYDLVGTVLAQMGVTTHFHKVAMKPGKPLLFATRGDVPFIGLPGNPVSSWVGFEIFVRPCLRRMLGHSRLYPRSITVRLGHPHTRSTGRIELARARFVHHDDHIEAHLIAQQGSGSLPSMVHVDGLVILPADQGQLAEGDRLPALVLHESRGQLRSAFL